MLIYCIPFLDILLNRTESWTRDSLLHSTLLHPEPPSTFSNVCLNWKIATCSPIFVAPILSIKAYNPLYVVLYINERKQHLANLWRINYQWRMTTLARIERMNIIPSRSIYYAFTYSCIYNNNFGNEYCTAHTPKHPLRCSIQRRQNLYHSQSAFRSSFPIFFFCQNNMENSQKITIQCMYTKYTLHISEKFVLSYALCKSLGFSSPWISNTGEKKIHTIYIRKKSIQEHI